MPNLDVVGQVVVKDVLRDVGSCGRLLEKLECTGTYSYMYCLLVLLITLHTSFKN